jgi:DNA-binding NtrC family response regulator
VLNQASVLVAEDEPFIALNLALAIEDAGGVVAGPAGSVREAMALLESTPVSAAILDVNLADGDISPVLEALVERGTPLIIHTSVALPEALAARAPGVVVRIKPCLAPLLVAQLAALIAEKRRGAPDNDPRIVTTK